MENINQKSWWQRNWKWVVPAGGCLTVLIVIFSFIGYGAYKAIDTFSNDTSIFAFVDVIQEIQKSEEVGEALGKPIRFDGLKDQNAYDPEASKTHLDLDFEIQGPKSDGILRVIADKTDDGWQYSTFTITVLETNQVINLKDIANE